MEIPFENFRKAKLSRKKMNVTKVVPHSENEMPKMKTRTCEVKNPRTHAQLRTMSNYCHITLSRCSAVPKVVGPFRPDTKSASEAVSGREGGKRCYRFSKLEKARLK